MVWPTSREGVAIGEMVGRVNADVNHKAFAATNAYHCGACLL